MEIKSTIYYALLAVFTFVFFFGLIYTTFQLWYFKNPRKRAVYIRSNKTLILPIIQKIIQENALNTKELVFFEPGAGDAGISLWAEKNFSWRNIYAYEINTFVFYITKIKLTLLRSKINYSKKDITKDFLPNQKKVIYCYLGSKLLETLYNQGIFKNAIVISTTFKIPEVTHNTKFEIQNSQKRVLMYDFRE